jgi:hypothetical protein
MTVQTEVEWWIFMQIKVKWWSNGGQMVVVY